MAHDAQFSAAREATNPAIEKSEIIRLSLDDQQAIAESILHPPPPAPPLIHAVKRCMNLLEMA